MPKRVLGMARSLETKSQGKHLKEMKRKRGGWSYWDKTSFCVISEHRTMVSEYISVLCYFLLNKGGMSNK
jgi:hypothetical protein